MVTTGRVAPESQYNYGSNFVQPQTNFNHTFGKTVKSFTYQQPTTHTSHTGTYVPPLTTAANFTIPSTSVNSNIFSNPKVSNYII